MYGYGVWLHISNNYIFWYACIFLGKQNYCSLWFKRKFIHMACKKTWKHTYISCGRCLYWAIYNGGTNISCWIKISFVNTCQLSSPALVLRFAIFILTKLNNTQFWNVVLSCVLDHWCCSSRCCTQVTVTAKVDALWCCWYSSNERAKKEACNPLLPGGLSSVVGLVAGTC